MECTYDANDPVNSPFTYFHLNGTVVKKGRLYKVPGFAEEVCKMKALRVVRKIEF